MRPFPILAVALLPIAPVMAQRPADAVRKADGTPRACRSIEEKISGRADRPAGAVQSRKLGELPPAAEIKAVWNRVDGCPEPVVVRRGIGAPPRR